MTSHVIWEASGHVDAFNDPFIDNKDSKKRYSADVLIEEHLAKMEDKISKEVEKAAKRFGDAFDEQKSAKPILRVLEISAKIEEARTCQVLQSPYRLDLDDSTTDNY